jgi:2-keto-3-deoxy-L-rhamnonate aldolase RhmA
MKRPRERPRKDAASFGVHLSFLCPEVIEFCGVLGFEWLFLDAQHTPLNHHLCRELVRAADVAGLFCMVRVPQIDAPVIEGFLDAGVLGIMAPNVSSAVEARALVSAVKFSPVGTRGAAARSRAASYGWTQAAADYVERANQETFTAALIEAQQGIDQLDAIMAVPGIDYIAIGPNDLGLSLGTASGMADPRVRAIVEDAHTRIKAHGKPQVAVVSNADQARAAVAAGATLIAVPDAMLLADAARAFLDKVGESS